MLSFTEINGDVLTPNNTDKTVIVCHQVNCFGVMGAGLALQIKQQLFPVYQNYLEACTGRQPEELLGKVSVCSMEKERGYSVANIFSQREHSCNGCLTQYDALSEAFLTVNYSDINDRASGFRFSHENLATINFPTWMVC